MNYITPRDLKIGLFSSLDLADFMKTVDVIVNLNEEGMLENFTQEELNDLRDYIYVHQDMLAEKVVH